MCFLLANVLASEIRDTEPNVEIQVLFDLNANGTTIDLNADGNSDRVKIARRTRESRGTVVRDAFGYGEATPDYSACILLELSLRDSPSIYSDPVWLCGRSPVLLLNEDVNYRDADKLWSVLSHEDLSKQVPAHLLLSTRGDALILQTEATESVLLWNGQKFLWEELSHDEAE